MTRRSLAAILLLLGACGSPSSGPPVSQEPRELVRATPVSDLQFNDWQLQTIARDVIREARLRGIEEVSGRNRVDRLLRLETSLGRSQDAMLRVNQLVAHLTSHDSSRWAKLRQRAEVEFNGRNDETAKRVRDLLARWRHEQSDIVFDYLSSNYKAYISSMEWERRFHDFVAARPVDAATWGWLLLREDADAPRREYGRADAETAYRYYLRHIGLGNAREARELFSMPGIEIAVPPTVPSPRAGGGTGGAGRGDR